LLLSSSERTQEGFMPISLHFCTEEKKTQIFAPYFFLLFLPPYSTVHKSVRRAVCTV
jgi:hypothetical protein